MSLLLDTNILIFFTKNLNVQKVIEIVNPDNLKAYVSTASIGEVKSIALRNKWGGRRIQIMNLLLDDLITLEVNENLVDAYAEIDAFSQCRNPSYVDYPFTTLRNMGKNDLWIAATASLLGLKLVTTDADFDHLNGEFIEVQFIKSEELMK
jgi:tRNA(fMet)-specific endonuclease VapC